MAIKAKRICENLWWKVLGILSLRTLWPNHMSTSQSVSQSVWCGTDDPTARAKKCSILEQQYAKDNSVTLVSSCDSNIWHKCRTHLLSVRSTEAGDKRHRHAALICECVSRETPPLNMKKKKKAENQNGCSKDPPTSDMVA